MGHGISAIGDCISAQQHKLDYVSNHRFIHEQGSRLSERLISLFPQKTFSSIYFTSGGAEAVDTSLKMAKQYWYNKGCKSKNRVISLYESYHGSTIGAVGVSGDPWDRIPFDPIINDSVHFYPQYCFRCRLGLKSSQCNMVCLSDLEYKIKFYGEENISALIMEPIMGVGGVIIPDKEYMSRIRELCNKYDILLIFDEVTSGIGRCGEYFSCIKYGIYPDMLLFGKAISNGSQPLGGVIVSEKVMNAFVSPDMQIQFRHGFTNSGHPVACASGNCVLDIFERDNIIELCRKKSECFSTILNRLKTYPFIGEIRIIGLMIAIELINPKDGTPLVISGLDIIFRNKGLLLSQMTQVICLMPPVIMTEEEFDKVVSIIAETIGEYVEN